MFEKIKNNLWISLIIIGLIILSLGFLYGAFMVGVPYQDPTPRMLMWQNLNYIISYGIMLVGFSAFLSGVLLAIVAIIKVARTSNSKM